MVILALETATRAGSLAIVTDRGVVSAITGDPNQTHGVRLPGDILRLLKDAGLTLREVDVFAAVTGPGSFTGLRVGLATTQGLALPHDRRVVAVPTLDALASGWIDAHATPEGPLVACLDAARGDVFYAAYDVAGVDRIEAAPVLIAPRVALPAVAASDVAAICGNRHAIFIGDGAERYASIITTGGPGATVGSPMPNLAAAAGRLAAGWLDRAVSPHGVRPVYVRRPDAELARDRGRPAPSTPPRETQPPHDDGSVGLSVFEVTDPDDLAHVAALQARTFGAAWPDEALAGGHTGGYRTRLFAARRQAGEIIGYCAGWEILDELHINSLAVDEQYRRQGIARELLERVLAQLSTAGVRSATLEVRASNAAGRALYERLGFRVEGIRRGYYEHPVEDALVLWRRP